jgi:outer membrane protein assembly factor BamB/AAA+ ATPase superfamily predicted ATPase
MAPLSSSAKRRADRFLKPVSSVLLALLVLLLAPLAALAQSGVANQPYWSFETEARVTAVEAADLDGDGLLEVAIGTADNQLYILENDGSLAWRYEAGGAISAIAQADLDGDSRAHVVVGSSDGTVSQLDHAGEPVWTFSASGTANVGGGVWAVLPCLMTADLEGDGQVELLAGSYDGQVYALDGSGQMYWSFDVGRPVLGIWAGDVDGDGLPEVAPNPYRGGDLLLLENDGHLDWQQHTQGEIGRVQGGDVDGDGQAEVVLLTASWNLFVYRGDGTLAWHSDAMALSHAHDTPESGQLLVRDLDGNGRAEIVVAAIGPRSTVYAFQDGGEQIWAHTLGTGGNATRLVAHDVDGDGDLEIAVTTPVYEPVYLLDSQGRLLAEYHTWGASGALELADLDGDGRDEVLVATETGLQVFGTSDEVERRELWRSPSLGPVAALTVGDTDGDGRGEVLAGSQDGRVYALTADGQMLWDVPLQAAVLALDAGDVDGDARDEVVVGTWGGAESAGGQVHLLDAGRRLWSVQAGQFVTGVVMTSDTLPRTSEAPGGLILAGVGSSSGGVVLCFDGDGYLKWQQAYAERVTAVGGDGERIQVGTQGGRVYRLSADGIPQSEHELGAAVISLGEGLAATAEGRIYRLDDHAPVLVGELDQPAKAIHVGTEGVTYALAEGLIGYLPHDGPAWQGAVDGEVTALTAGDLDGDRNVELAVATSRGRVHLFGLAVNQPPLLTRPGLAETRTGYAYSIEVSDPEGDTVTVVLEVWDPSAERWLVQPAQPLDGGHGRLSWEVRNPFDTWDAGRDSHYRFAYDDGLSRGTVAAAPGPLTIAEAPWFVHYGRYAGGLVLLALLASPLALYARRIRTYRRSPVGRAEASLHLLREAGENLLPALHRLVADDDWAATVLPHLPGLARDTGKSTLADLAEGYYLVLTRPDVPRTAEGLRLLLTALATAESLVWGKEVQNLYKVCLRALEANSVSCITALRGPLGGMGAVLDHPDFFLTNAAQAFAGLAQVGEVLRHYERVEMPEDKVVYLAQAAQVLGGYDRQALTALARPEEAILGRVINDWLQVITRATRELQGRAQLEVVLQTQQAVAASDVVLGLELHNVGRSPATNVRVELLPGRGYEVVQGRTALEQLPARRIKRVELTVRPIVQDQFRAEFEIRYDDQEGADRVQHFADRVRLVAVPEKFIEIPNPYATGRPLGPGSPVFFGRDDLFDFVRENLGGPGQENILVLVGQRRMGKTSLLRQLPARVSEEYVPVFLDGQALGFEGGVAGLLYDVALEIVGALVDQGIDGEAPAFGDLAERPTHAFEKQFLPQVAQVLDGRVLLLLFDEFEELEMRVRAGELSPSIFSYLRHLMQHSRNLAFLFAGTHRLEDLTADYWSILFNIALYRRVGTLDAEAARRLIVEPVQDYGLVYDDLAVDKMLRVTGGHPYFLQLLCYALVNLHNRERRNYLTIEDVSCTLAEIVGLGEAQLAFLWSESTPQERAVLLALTRLLSAGEPGTQGAIVEVLEEFGLRVSRAGIAEAIGQMLRREILQRAEQGANRYEFTLDLMRLWLEESKSLGLVAEEMM